VKDLKRKLKVFTGSVVLFWLASPIPEISIILGFVTTASMTDLPLVYAVPPGIVLGLGFKEVVERYRLEDKIIHEVEGLEERYRDSRF
jgi:hypothetical protein